MLHFELECFDLCFLVLFKQLLFDLRSLELLVDIWCFLMFTCWDAALSRIASIADTCAYQHKKLEHCLGGCDRYTGAAASGVFLLWGCFAGADFLARWKGRGYLLTGLFFSPLVTFVKLHASTHQKWGRWLFFLNRYCIFQEDETVGANFEANFIFPLLDSKVIFPVYS